MYSVSRAGASFQSEPSIVQTAVSKPKSCEGNGRKKIPIVIAS